MALPMVGAPPSAAPMAGADPSQPPLGAAPPQQGMDPMALMAMLAAMKQKAPAHKAHKSKGKH